jgi:hypothetical protein
MAATGSGACVGYSLLELHSIGVEPILTYKPATFDTKASTKPCDLHTQQDHHDGRHRRVCAACGRTPADGAQLRRCAGCGRVTGVMYCGDACCRRHWVLLGHREQCEAAQHTQWVEMLDAWFSSQDQDEDLD